MPCPSSPRLRFDELSANDTDFILQLTNSEGWLRYIGDRGIRTPDDACRYIDEGPRTLYREHGFGLWRISRLDDPTPMGVCGLVKRDSLPGPDLGFAFLPAFWGAGYAREAASACLAFAREALQLRELLAICQPDNAASLRLLEALGFERVERFRHDTGPELWKLRRSLGQSPAEQGGTGSGGETPR
jgi:ribosomal-protein-alanine N-acetyltransferase